MTPEEEEQLDRIIAARRSDEKEIAKLKAELATTKAKLGAAEMHGQTLEAKVRTDRASATLVAAFVKLGVRSDAAKHAADSVLADGDPEFDAEGNLKSATVHGLRSSDVAKMADRELEKSAWLHRAVGLPEQTSAEPGGKAPPGGKVDLLTANLRDLGTSISERIGKAEGVGKPGRARPGEDVLTMPMSELNARISARLLGEKE